MMFSSETDVETSSALGEVLEIMTPPFDMYTIYLYCFLFKLPCDFSYMLKRIVYTMDTGVKTFALGKVLL